MPLEIEYRYLLPALPDLGDIKPSHIVQGYLQRSYERTHRIRVEEYPDGTTKAFETIKGPKIGPSGEEDEKVIPINEARKLLEQCKGEFIEKDRYKIPVENHLKWELDRFKGKLTGLFIAEIEVPSEDTAFDPAWLGGVDITNDKRFANALLVDVTPDELQRNIHSVFESSGIVFNHS